MMRGPVGRRWAAVIGVLGAAVAAQAADAPGSRALVEEFFVTPRAIPAVVKYDKPPPQLQALIDRGEGWHLIVGPGSSASAQVVGGAAVVRIAQAGLESYAVQLAYMPVRLQPGRSYRVSFRARAERDAFTSVQVSQVGGTWKSYSGKKELDVGRGWRDYEVKFTTGATDRDDRARLEFDFRDEADVAVLIDDVRMVEEPPPGKG